MPAPANEQPIPHPPLSVPHDPETVVTPVGTFAAGQAAEGAFLVAADAEVGTFAAGLATDGSDEVANEGGARGAA
jgi:hypothetical protein